MPFHSFTLCVHERGSNIPNLHWECARVVNIEDFDDFASPAIWFGEKSKIMQTILFDANTDNALGAWNINKIDAIETVLRRFTQPNIKTYRLNDYSYFWSKS